MIEKKQDRSRASGEREDEERIQPRQVFRQWEGMVTLEKHRWLAHISNLNER